jgi:hypothetical protein
MKSTSNGTSGCSIARGKWCITPRPRQYEAVAAPLSAAVCGVQPSLLVFPIGTGSHQVSINDQVLQLIYRYNQASSQEKVRLGASDECMLMPICGEKPAGITGSVSKLKEFDYAHSERLGDVKHFLC